jgi:hypothetical protein
MKPRATLKDYFKRGKIPKESDFADLIDSMLVQDEDSVFKTPNGPLSIKATGAEEGLIDFYDGQNGSTPTWRLMQKSGDKVGLSIGDGASADSRLFIESGTGRVGIGTSSPGAKLDVNGGLTVRGNLRMDLGSDRKLSLGGNGTFEIDAPGVVGGRLIVTNEGNVGIGAADPKNTLQLGGNLHLDGHSIFLRTDPTDKYDVIKWNSGSDRIDIGGYNGVNLGYTSTGGPNAITSVLTVTSGNVGIGATAPASRLEIRTATNNGGSGSLNPPEELLRLYREGVDNQSWPNIAVFSLSRYALENTYARTRLDIGLSHDNFNNMTSIMSIRSDGNVGIGTTDPQAKLTIRGDLIRKVAIATGLGPEDAQDNGQITSRVLSFMKQYADTAIRILYCDNFRVFGVDVAARWEIRIDGKSVPGGAIYQDKYGSAGNYHEPATIVGYAQGVNAGTHQIQVWVTPTPGFPHLNTGGSIVDVHTGWSNSRWTIEAQEVWL